MDKEAELEEFLGSLDVIQRRIIELTMENASDERIAHTVKRSIRTVRHEQNRFAQEIQRCRRVIHDLTESSDSCER